MSLLRWQDKKINIQKQLHYYTKYEQSVREYKRAILNAITSKRIKTIMNNLTKVVKYLYAKKYKTLMK